MFTALNIEVIKQHNMTEPLRQPTSLALPNFVPSGKSEHASSNQTAGTNISKVVFIVNAFLS